MDPPKEEWYFPKEVWYHIRNYVSGETSDWKKKFTWCSNQIRLEFTPYRAAGTNSTYCIRTGLVKEYFKIKAPSYLSKALAHPRCWPGTQAAWDRYREWLCPDSTCKRSQIVMYVDGGRGLGARRSRCAVAAV